MDGVLDVCPGKVYLGPFGEVGIAAGISEDIPEEWAGCGDMVYIEAGIFEGC